MNTIDNTSVTFIDKNDLRREAQTRSIDDVNIFDVKDRDVYQKAKILILSLHGEKRILKNIYSL